MISLDLWIPLLVLAVLVSVWITFTLTRLDRLHARVDAAYAALDAQLVRRAAALLQGAESVSGPGAVPPSGWDPRAHLRVASEALQANTEGQDVVANREVIENKVGRSITELAVHTDAVSPQAQWELHEACTRLVIARRFYNDAVRDTRGLRERRIPRILHLAGHRELPQFFDIDDALSFPAVGLTDGTGLAAAVHPDRGGDPDHIGTTAGSEVEEAQ